jgi:hypothetical protein
MNPIDPPRVSRRQFVKMTTLASVAVASGCTSFERRRGPADNKPLYTFPLLGDIHYDKFSHHDMDWVRKEKPGDERQIKNYVMVTETFTPRLLAGVREAIKASSAATPFVIQVGDLVEGLCGSYDLQALQFRDTFAAIDAAGLGVPFLITKGNHDITGPGAVEAYNKELIPWLAGQGKQEKFAGASYFRKHQEDLFVFFDGYVPDLDWLERTLEKNKARHVFFIVHQPIIPYNARSNWGVFSRQAEADRRGRLLALLGKHNAIILSGHLHKYCVLNRSHEAGPMVQLAVSSVLRNADEGGAAKALISGVERYDESLVNLEPKFSPDTVELRRGLLRAERPSITRFEYCDVPGYAMVKVYADRVEADLFVGLSNDAWKTDAIHVPAAAAS